MTPSALWLFGEFCRDRGGLYYYYYPNVADDLCQYEGGAAAVACITLYLCIHLEEEECAGDDGGCNAYEEGKA